MAFPYNYPFLVLILFPGSLCVVHALNYAVRSLCVLLATEISCCIGPIAITSKLIFNKTCKATGYYAVGFTETTTGRNMEMYDIAAGFFVSSITTPVVQ